MTHTQDDREGVDVLKQVKAMPQQLHANIMHNQKIHRQEKQNLTSGVHANKTSYLPNIVFDNIRFQRGCTIVNRKDQIKELDELRYGVKSQTNCGEYEVISTELGWICSCADHMFRDVVCKHLYAIFLYSKREQAPKFCNQDMIEL